MKSVTRIATAFAAGAAIMYFFDPLGGRRRRALVRDRGMSAGHDAQRYVRGQSRLAADRAKGMFARARSALSQVPVEDERLHDRIRARMGHLLAHPGHVEVVVEHGFVTLRGSAERGEIELLHDAVLEMRGVEGVENQLTPMSEAERAGLASELGGRSSDAGIDAATSLEDQDAADETNREQDPSTAAPAGPQARI
jgi:hyperosmotically inducible periplasmic protein